MTQLSDPIETVIGTIIREARLLRNVTQESLADAIGKSRTTVVNMESGTQGVSLSVLYDIAAALEVSVYDLLPDESMKRSSATWAELGASRRRVDELERRFARVRKLLDV